MQLTTLLLLLASVCCASAIQCYKGGNLKKDKTLCPDVKDTCSTTTYEEKHRTTWTCASHEECHKWKADALEEGFDYRVFCCNTHDYCNDMDNLYSEEYDAEYAKK